MKNLVYTLIFGLAWICTGCSDFLESQTPQGSVDEEQLQDPAYIDNLVISAYAVWISAEDINSSFSLWNYDVRSDDAYKGGNGTEDGDVFHSVGNLARYHDHRMEHQRHLATVIQQHLTRKHGFKISERDGRNHLSGKAAAYRGNAFPAGHGHFLLKQLFKKIVIANDETLDQEGYNNLSNDVYTNDESWAEIAGDFESRLQNLPVTQEDKGRPTRAAAAAYLAKTYLYKAYRQDDDATNEVTSINAEDLLQVVKYTDKSIMSAGGYGLEPDFHNNFRPEPEYENGVESLWAMQYSMNDGTKNGNCNWSNGLIVPNIPGVTDGGNDFYKPSQNLVNAFRTDAGGHPLFDSFNTKNYDKAEDNADPRLFLTVGMPEFPYEFNTKYMMKKNNTWSRSGGLYGYNVTLKQNVDPDGGYLVKGSYWGTPMNHIVLRYADVLLMRAEALIQLNDGRIEEAVSLINEVRSRAGQSVTASTSVIKNYAEDYGVKIKVEPYNGTYSQTDALKMLKFERRVELAMECDRFFDLVRWGEAAEVLNKYYAEEAADCSIYSNASFTKNKNEYLPIPFAQISASNGRYVQNCGNW